MVPPPLCPERPAGAELEATFTGRPYPRGAVPLAVGWLIALLVVLFRFDALLPFVILVSPPGVLALVAAGLPLVRPRLLGLAVAEDALHVRYRFFGERVRSMPLTDLRVLGRSGTLLRVGDAYGGFATWCARKERERVDAWITRVKRLPGVQLAERRGRVGTLVETTHAGATYVVHPVYPPLPIAVWAAMGVFTFGVFGTVGFAVGDAAGVGIGVAAALVAVLLPVLAAARVRHVVLRVDGPRLELVAHRSVGARRWSVPLADLRDVHLAHRALVLTREASALRIPLPDRSRASNRALAAFVAEHVTAAAERRGAVPDEMRGLLETHRERER